MRRLYQRYSRPVLSLGLLLSVAGCAVEHGGMKTSRIWRDRWWNYYERGVLYAERQAWQEAVADFQAAIVQNHKDDRDARTYGMHFLGYFPHRELGVVYYRLGRYTDAARELEASLDAVQTARAKFYLNRARQRQLEQNGRDTAAPQLVLDELSDGMWTNRLALTVSGRAEDDTYVAAVVIQGQPQFVELAEPRLRFTQEVPLSDGRNVIEVVATDLVGRQTQERRTVYVDRHGPLLSLARVTLVGEPSPQRARIEGLVADDSPIQRFILAGRNVPVSPDEAWEFRQEVALTADMKALPFEVADAAGNVTRGEIVLSLPASGPAGVREGKAVFPPRRERQGDVWPPDPGIPWLPRWAALPQGTAMSDLPTVLPVSSQRVAQAEGSPPIMHLTTVEPGQVVYNDAVYLGGTVTAASAIVAFSINGASRLPKKSVGRLKSRQLFFGSLLPLQVGENHFLLEAQDDTGLATQHEVVVRRQVQEFRQLASRWYIAVLPFCQQGMASDQCEQALPFPQVAYDHLLTALVQQQRFRPVERERLADILREQELSHTPFVDPSTAIRVGKLVAAESSVSGVVVQRASHALEVTASFIDIETGKILATLDVYGENVTRDDIKPLMHGLAWKFQQHFPLVEGAVMERNGKHVLVNHGSPLAPLQSFMKLLLFREGAPVTNRKTGMLLGRPVETLGEARVETVSDTASTAVLLPSASKSSVKKLDKYITK